MSYSDKKIQIDELQQKINDFGKLSVEVQNKINYKFRLDWNYYSNSMEGNTLTMDETRSVMVGNLTVGGKPFKDILEMKGHDDVISEILKIGKGEIRLSEKRIRDIHIGIMHEENESEKEKIGKWKTTPNYIYNYKGERFDFVQPSEVAERMHDLLNKTNAGIDAIKQQKKNAPHSLDVALQFHLDYVLIHPFYDGNGRTARILTNLLLISFGYPPFWVKEKERGIYSQYIGDIQGYGGDPNLFFEFTAGLILRSQQIMLDAIEGKDIEEQEDYIKEIQLIKQQTNKQSIPKSPKLVYDVFKNVESKIWRKLSETLGNFDELFSDSNTIHYLNGMDEKFGIKNIIQPAFIVSTEPTKYKVFGFDVYEMDIGRAEWQHTKYGLKGSNDNGKFETKFRIGYEIQNYKLILSINNNIVSELQKQYADPISETEIDTINKALKDYMLPEIKKRIITDN